MSPGGASAVALAGLAAVGATACESSQSKNDKLAKSGVKAAVLGSVSAGAANANVRVGKTTILRGDLGTAVVIKVTNTGPEGQVAVPIQIDVKDEKRTSVYKNDIDGLQPALQQLALLPRGKSVYWVNDQVTAATPAKRVKVDVGKPKGRAPRGALPEIILKGVKLDEDSSGTLITGVVENRSKLVQKNMPIYGVVTKGAKVVAAGRALIEKLGPEPQKKPTVFRIFLIGDPSGGELDVRPVPTVLTQGA